MKHEAVQAFRAKLAADTCVYGLWVTLESPSITEMAVALGLDWVVIDAEHGHLDWGDLVGHVRATVRSRTVCLIRIAALDQGLIKRALDIGADGVVVPWAETAEQVRAMVHAAQYPLAGRRGIGAERATAWGRCTADHVAEAKDILVVPIIESVLGGENAAAMAAVDGVNLFFVGPADWSSTAGQAGGWAGPAVAQQINATCATIRAAGKQVGLITTSEDDLRRRRHLGFRMLALGIDGALLLRSLDSMLTATGSLRAITTALVPRQLGTQAEPLRATPPALKSERLPRVIEAAQAPKIELDDHVLITPFVGRHCAARDLTAAIARFAPGGTLVRHQHPEPETVVVLAGSISTEIDGRRHRLETGDSITIPANTPHQTGNADANAEAVIHVAMPCDTIPRTLVPPLTGVVDIAAGTREDQARRRDRNQSAAVEHFVEHSGLTRPGGRVRCRSLRLEPGQSLPARVQAVDTAIVVVDGRLRCRTERETWTVAGLAAIHLPQGTAYELAAGDGPVDLIETCADLEPLDACFDPARLHAAAATTTKPG